MKYMVDVFGRLGPVTEVSASDALDLALLDLKSGKVPREELILSARVYEQNQDGNWQEGNDAA